MNGNGLIKNRSLQNVFYSTILSGAIQNYFARKQIRKEKTFAQMHKCFIILILIVAFSLSFPMNPGSSLSSAKLKLFQDIKDKLKQIEEQVEGISNSISISMQSGNEFVNLISWGKLEDLRKEKEELLGQIFSVEKEIQAERMFTRVPGSPKQKID